MNDTLQIKLAGFKEQLLKFLSNPENVFTLSKDDKNISKNLNYLRESIVKNFLKDGRISLESAYKGVSTPYIDKQIKQQEELLKLIGYKEKLRRHGEQFILDIPKVSHRAHYKYLRAPIYDLGERACCNFEENGQTACYNDFEITLRVGPDFEGKAKGWCICCTRKVQNNMHGRKSFYDIRNGKLALNNYRYEYDKKCNCNPKEVIVPNPRTRETYKFVIEERYKDEYNDYVYHEDMRMCEMNEYSSKYGYMQEGNSNYGLIGFYPYYDKVYYKKQDHYIIVFKGTKIARVVSIEGLKEFFFFRGF